MSTASDRLALYLTAEAAILSGGQEVRIDGRLLREGDIAEIRAEISQLRREVASEIRIASGGNATRFARAVFNE